MQKMLGLALFVSHKETTITKKQRHTANSYPISIVVSLCLCVK